MRECTAKLQPAKTYTPDSGMYSMNIVLSGLNRLGQTDHPSRLLRQFGATTGDDMGLAASKNKAIKMVVSNAHEAISGGLSE